MPGFILQRKLTPVLINVSEINAHYRGKLSSYNNISATRAGLADSLFD